MEKYCLILRDTLGMFIDAILIFPVIKKMYLTIQMHLARYKKLRENDTMTTEDEIIEINDFKDVSLF